MVDCCADLVNQFTAEHQQGRPTPRPRTSDERAAAARTVLHNAGRPDPGLDEAATRDLARLAASLRQAVDACVEAELPTAAAVLNRLLTMHRAVLNLHADADQPPTLAFHRPDATPVEAWAADSAACLAMVAGTGQAHRVRRCQASGCERVYFDTTRNASRRFCGTTCQNRVKSANYRARKG
jgi:predicted RNA-binding Zn ribbon-like protein